MGTLQRRGNRDGGGQVRQDGFFRVVLHCYMQEADERRLRGGYYLPDEERASLL